MSKAGARILQGAQEALVLAKGKANQDQYQIHAVSGGISAEEVERRRKIVS